MKGEINILKIVGIGVLVLVLLGVGGSLLLSGKDNDSSSNGAGTIVESDSNHTEERETNSLPATESSEVAEISDEEKLNTYFQQIVLAEMQMISPFSEVITYSYEESIEAQPKSGIVSYRIMDLDKDATSELIVIYSAEREYYFAVYEVEEENIVKKADRTLGYVGFTVGIGTDDISIISMEQCNYILFTSYYAGLIADGYEAEVSMWRYDGTSILPVMDIIQTDGGSAYFEYEAHHYNSDGSIVETIVIYNDPAEDEPAVYDENGSIMKSQFSRYGIDINPEYLMFNHLEKMVTDAMMHEVLYRENKWGEVVYSNDGGYPFVTVYTNRMSEVTVKEGDYILPNSDSTYLTINDLMGLTKEQCRIARNEIYARHNRMFTAEDLKVYFASKSWYKGVIDPEWFTDDLLNEYELYNRDLITQYEADMGYN